MSTVGGTTAAGFNLAGSIVGSSRPDALADHNKGAQAAQRSQVDRDAAIKQASEDVADAQFSTDRDADGRQLYQRRAPVAAPEDAPEETEDSAGSTAPVARSHASDAFGDRGNALDIDA